MSHADDFWKKNKRDKCIYNILYAYPGVKMEFYQNVICISFLIKTFTLFVSIYNI